MRRIALLTLPLLLLGFFSLSAGVDEATGLEFTVSGESTLTFGVDLDDSSTGFYNTEESDLDLTLVASTTSDTGTSDETVYAFIELSSFKWAVDSSSATVTAPGITTKLFLGPAYVQTGSAPDVDIDFVTLIGSDGTDTDTTYDGDYGFTFGFSQDPLDLTIDFVSYAEGTDGAEDEDGDDVDDADGTANTDNSYALEVNLGLAVAPADIDVALAYGFGDAYSSTPIGVALKTTLDLGQLDPYIALDLQSDTDVAFDIGAGLDFEVVSDLTVGADLTVNSVSDVTVIDAGLDFSEGINGAIPGVGVTVGVDLTDLTATSALGWAIDVTGDYTVNGIMPFFELGLTNDGTDTTTDLAAGLELANIDNLVTTVLWQSSDVGTVNGTLTASLTISY